MHSKLTILALSLAAAAHLSCEEQVGSVPVSLEQYQQMSPDDAKTFPVLTILQVNLQRALDAELDAQERVDSLQLVMRLGGADPAVLDQLAAAMGDAKTPEPVRMQILGVLLDKDYPGMGKHVVQAVPHLKRSSPLREKVLEWLTRHPAESDLSEIVRMWAMEPVNGPDEARFRILVEAMTSRQWDAAMLDGINARGAFYARGSALEILAARLDEQTLRRKIMDITAETTAMAALKTFVGAFLYVPRNGQDLLTIATLYRTQTDRIIPAATLNRQWLAEYGYRFQLRDFHLLSRLASDPSYRPKTRSQLIGELGQTFLARQHVRHRPSARGAADDYVDLFSAHVESLSIADMWNLHLIDQMLSTPRIQQALRVVDARDRADTSSAWGGLIFCENAQAAAKLYPPRKGSNDDAKYAPSEKLEEDARDCLCRFHGHFEKVYNQLRAGPDAAELQAAQDGDYYGLILTSVSEFAFCAHYYNPRGIVVSLGKFPFRE